MKIKHVLWLILLQIGCSAGTTVTEPVSGPGPEPVISVESRRVLAPVPHDGPLAVEPGFYDCGEIPEFTICEHEFDVTHGEEEAVEILDVAQDFSVYARIGLIQDSTAFSRDLPYSMSAQDPLRLVFSYRRDDPEEVVGGSLFLRYVHGGREYRIEIPVGADN